MPLFNPPAHLLGRENAVVGGRGVRRYEHRFAGPLSIKAVISGEAVWSTGHGSFRVLPGSVLLVDEGEEYEIRIDALQPVETFCLFFRRGFVEDAWQAETTGSALLLDGADPRPPAFGGTVQVGTALAGELSRAHARMRLGEPFEEVFPAAALHLVRTHSEFLRRIARLPALRASTREELGRRVAMATAFLHANADRNVRLAEAARAACLSPFHFHRLFVAVHGVTPHRYLSRVRLQRALEMLRAGRPVAEAAAECGFDSVGSFSTLFRRTFGTTPGAIRKNEEAPVPAQR